MGGCPGVRPPTVADGADVVHAHCHDAVKVNPSDCQTPIKTAPPPPSPSAHTLNRRQDAYYSEGLKLPLILPLFKSKAALALKAKAAKGKAGAPYKELSARDKRLQRILGADVAGVDDAGILGFREHIFTHGHSVVGRYMALAEHAFGTLVQRFLSDPHHIRMHYGHPDMTNAHLMRRTGGVSRGSLRVNVNEDIFLGYEMLLQVSSLPESPIECLGGRGGGWGGGGG